MNSYRAVRVFAAVAGVFCTASLAMSSTPPPRFTEEAKVSDAMPSDQFGCSTALQGTRAVIGSLNGDGKVSDSGTAFVYERNANAWTEVAKLSANDGGRFDDFGYSVSLDGLRVAVGAKDASHSNLDYPGAAYIFDRTGGTWGQAAKIRAQDAASLDGFGYAISVLGNRVLVSAIKDDYSGRVDVGSAYLFDRQATGIWSQTAKLTPLDPQASMEFGTTVGLGFNRALVGADFDTGRTGAAYVFEPQNSVWSQTAKLTASDGRSADRFGYSVAISGNRILIGSPLAQVAGEFYAGAAYVFELNDGQWTQVAKLTDLSARRDAYFGFHVALEDNRAVIFDGGDVKSAIVFDLIDGAWTQTMRFQASDGVGNDAFGEGLALSGARVLVGARLADTASGVDAGAAYFFAVPEPPSALLTLCGAACAAAACRIRRRTRTGKRMRKRKRDITDSCC